jgi:hypothetical protein
MPGASRRTRQPANRAERRCSFARGAAPDPIDDVAAAASSRRTKRRDAAGGGDVLECRSGAPRRSISPAVRAPQVYRLPCVQLRSAHNDRESGDSREERARCPITRTSRPARSRTGQPRRTTSSARVAISSSRRQRAARALPAERLYLSELHRTMEGRHPAWRDVRSALPTWSGPGE